MSTGLSSEFAGVAVASGSGSSNFNYDHVDRNVQRQNDAGYKPVWQTSITEYFTALTSDQEKNERRESRSELHNFIFKVQAAVKGKRIFHDVVPNITATRSQGLLTRCLQQKYKGGFFWWVFHTDHVHVVHDCSWSGGYCRCSRMQDLPIKRANRTSVWNYDFNCEYICNLSKYLLQPPRQSVYCEVAGRAWSFPSEIRSLSNEADRIFREISMVETSSNTAEFSNSIPCRSPTDTSGPNHQQSNPKYSTATKFKKRSQEEELLQFFKQYPTSPILNLLLSRVWYNSKFKFMRRNDPILQVVVDNFNCELLDFSVQNIFEYVQTCTPLYHAPRGDIYEYYYSIDESISVLNLLLRFQFNDDEVEIIAFLNNLLGVIEKHFPKINCFQVIGAPSSGKNFFFDCILHYFFNFGQIGNFNKYNSFPLQEAVNRRILLWNEPNCEPGSFDTIKMLFGGDSLNCKVKYQHDYIIHRTPVIVLSNKNVFPNDPAFKCRMITYTWNYCEFLRNYSKKPLPLSVYYIFKNYNLLNE